MKKTKTLSEKLKSYSLLAGSMLTSSVVAQAQVIYTDIVPDKEIGGVPPTTFPETLVENIDLNNDGIFDFKLTLKFYGLDTVIGGYSFREKVEAINPSNAIMTYTIEYVPFGLKLDCEDSIPKFANFYGFNFGNLAYQFEESVAYNWNNVHDKLLGLKFVTDTIHYGWLRLDVNTADTVPNIILKDYAYQYSPITKIAACDTGMGFTGIVPLAEAQKGLLIFPNPSNGKCVITWNELITGDAELSVKDAAGREVITQHVPMIGTKRELPLEFSSLSQGVYFIELRSADAVLSAKWIKE